MLNFLDQKILIEQKFGTSRTEKTDEDRASYRPFIASAVKLGFMGFLIFFNISCGLKNSPRDSKTARIPRLASAEIRSSFALINDLGNDQTIDQENKSNKNLSIYSDPLSLLESKESFGQMSGSLLKLKKAALGKAFLFSSVMLTSGILGDNSPIPDQMLPKVVSFETNGSELALYELNIYSFYQELPSERILQTFSIVSEDQDSVTFKWNYGIHAISNKSTLGVSELPETLAVMTSSLDTLMPVVSSFLKRIEFVGNQLELVQITQIKVRESDSQFSSLKPIHFKMTLAPYRPNPRFKPLLGAMSKGLGFYEIAQTRKKVGVTDSYAVRWDLSPEAGPITYQITKNAPPEMVPAIEEGVLYWNKVFGREVVRVEKDVDLSKHHPGSRKVPIYWVPFGSSNMSIASFQPDPLTGEIFAATVLLTSSFADTAKSTVRVGLQMNASINKNEAAQNNSTTPSGFQNSSWAPNEFTSSTLCQFSDPSDWTDPHGIQKASDSAVVLRGARDHVRSLTAHEVGHTLGLLHNFAGSSSSELESAQEHLSYWKAYLTDAQHAGAAVSSTVMDYLDVRDDILLGAAIREKPLPYDVEVMKWGYSKEPVEIKDLNLPRFCSDIDVRRERILGCGMHDSGRHPIQGFTQELTLKLQYQNIVQNLLDVVLERLRPLHPADQRSVRETIARLHPDLISMYFTRRAYEIFANFTTQSKSMIVDQKFGGLDWMNQKAYREETDVFLSESFNQVGGLPGVFRSLLGTDHSMKLMIGQYASQAIHVIEHPGFGKGTTSSGISYELTSDEIADLKLYFPQLLEKVEEAVLRDLIFSLTGFYAAPGNEENLMMRLFKPQESTDPTYSEAVIQSEWQDELSALAEQIILKTSGKMVSGVVDKDTVSVPEAAYGIQTRLAAVRLLNGRLFSRDVWAIEARNRMIDGVKNRALLVARELTAASPSKINPFSKKEDTSKDFFDLSVRGMNLSKELRIWIFNELALYVALKLADQ